MEKVHETVIDLTDDESLQLLDLWSWLFRGMRLVTMNSFGDLFLEGEEGEVWLLDTGLGELQKIARSEGEFREMARDAKSVSGWFMADLVQSARERGLVPKEGECLAFRKALALGGSISLDNLQVMSFLAYHLICSRINDERRTRPLGAMLEGFPDD